MVVVSDTCLTGSEGKVNLNVKVIGCGGSGSNTVNRCADQGMPHVDMCAIDTDARHLYWIHAPKKILIGRSSANRLGTGSCPEVGERAARENEGEIRNFLEGSYIVFVAAGLGGGTGTGSAPFVAGLSKEVGALTVGMATMPFSHEGKFCAGIAKGGLERLRKVCDATFVIPNDRLLEEYPTMSLEGAFMQADTVLRAAISGVIRKSAMPGSRRIGPSDILDTMTESGTVLRRIGKTRGTAVRQPRTHGYIVRRISRSNGLG
jgi:cell division protein FtsZ